MAAAAYPPVFETLIDRLFELGITDAEQLVALSAIQEVKPHLLESARGDAGALDRLVSDATALVSPGLLATLKYPSPPIFHLGALEPTSEMLAQMPMMAIEAPPANMPSFINLIPFMPPIRTRHLCRVYADRDQRVRLRQTWHPKERPSSSNRKAK